jgi:hypothetical protein
MVLSMKEKYQAGKMKDAAETSLPSLCNVVCHQNIVPVFVFERARK